MKVIDLNILLYAINPSVVQHKPVLIWWEQALNSDAHIGLPWVVLSGFIRLSTHPKIFPRPLPVATALGKVNDWLALPNVKVIAEAEGHWLIFKELLNNAGSAGNLTTDAHIAAIAIGHAATLASCDHDFARFGKLRWENPLMPPS